MKISKACFSPRLKMKKGDKVKVTIGKDKGRQGTIEKIFPKKGKILVSGINIYKKHARAQKGGKTGGIIDIVVPIPSSSVVLICPKCGKPAKVGFKILKDGKVRICKKCQEAI